MKRLITLCLICFSLLAHAKIPFTHLVVFGDSLSDNGNSYERTNHYIPQTPPYFMGRFSDGLVWTELLAKKMTEKENFLLDFAIGGAGVTAEDEDIEGTFTLANQVKEYLRQNNQVADSQNLYVIWIGANNYLILPDEIDETVDTVKVGTEKAIDKLIDAGANHFLVVNLPDLSKTPFAKAVDVEERTKLQKYSAQHNQMLQALIEHYHTKYPNKDWHFFDVHQMFENILANPMIYGISNVTDTCFEEDFKANISLRPVVRLEYRFVPEPKKACEQYLFFDPVHPTNKAHRIMSEQVLENLSDVLDSQSVS